MRRVLTQVRALLKGERVPLAPGAGARPLRLNLPPAPRVPIYLAAPRSAAHRAQLAYRDRRGRRRGAEERGVVRGLLPHVDGPFYPRSISRLGFEREVQAVIAAIPRASRRWCRRKADVLPDELTIYGTPDEARARLELWRDAGAELPILLLPAQLEPAQIDFVLSALV